MPGNNSPNLGTQILFRPNSKLTLNYSTFIGNDKPDSVKQMRYYHNLYAIWQPTAKWGLITGFDYGMEQKAKGSRSYHPWYSLTAIVRYSFNEKLAAAVRAEYYDDEKGVIIFTGTPSGFKTTGYSVNLDYKPEDRLLLRMEARMFDSKDAIFIDGSTPTNQNYFIASSIAIAL